MFISIQILDVHIYIYRPGVLTSIATWDAHIHTDLVKSQSSLHRLGIFLPGVLPSGSELLRVGWVNYTGSRRSRLSTQYPSPAARPSRPEVWRYGVPGDTVNMVSQDGNYLKIMK